MADETSPASHDSEIQQPSGILKKAQADADAEIEDPEDPDQAEDEEGEEVGDEDEDEDEDEDDEVEDPTERKETDIPMMSRAKNLCRLAEEYEKDHKPDPDLLDHMVNETRKYYNLGGFAGQVKYICLELLAKRHISKIHCAELSLFMLGEFGRTGDDDERFKIWFFETEFHLVDCEAALAASNETDPVATSIRNLLDNGFKGVLDEIEENERKEAATSTETSHRLSIPEERAKLERYKKELKDSYIEQNYET